jgi:hypothetical protein
MLTFCFMSIFRLVTAARELVAKKLVLTETHVLSRTVIPPNEKRLSITIILLVKSTTILLFSALC